MDSKKLEKRYQLILGELASAEEFDIFSTDLPLHYLLALPIEHRPINLEEFLRLQPAEISKSDPDHKVFAGLYPLHVAARNNEPDDFQRLLKHGADINSKSAKGKTVLHYACRGLFSPHFVETMIKSGVDVNHVSDSGKTALGVLLNAVGRLGGHPDHALHTRSAKDIAIYLFNGGAYFTQHIRRRLEDSFGKSFLSLTPNRVVDVNPDVSNSDIDCLDSDSDSDASAIKPASRTNSLELWVQG